MTAITRRRFLAALAAVLGAGGVGALLSRSGGDPAVVAPSTSTTLRPPATTSSTTTSAVPTTNTTQSPPTTAPPEGPQVICKAAWGALPVAGDFTQHTIEQITVHHTAVVLDDNADAPSRVRQHQSFHQGRGWPDLAYHYIIDAEGNVYEGRPVDAVGDTGTDYDPTGHFLVCCEGDFNQQELPAAQYASLVQMVAWGAAEFGVDPNTIQGHRDLAATSCPGDNLYAVIARDTLQEDVEEAVDGMGELLVVCGAEGRDRVAAIESK